MTMEFDPALGFPREMPDLRKRSQPVDVNPLGFTYCTTSGAPFMMIQGAGMIAHTNQTPMLGSGSVSGRYDPPPKPMPWYCDQHKLMLYMLKWIGAVIASGVAIDIAVRYL